MSVNFTVSFNSAQLLMTVTAASDSNSILGVLFRLVFAIQARLKFRTTPSKSTGVYARLPVGRIEAL